MYVVLVHSRDTEKAKNNVVELEPDPEPDLGMYDGKECTVEEQEGGHGTAVVPVGGVEYVDV